MALEVPLDVRDVVAVVLWLVVGEEVAVLLGEEEGVVLTVTVPDVVPVVVAELVGVVRSQDLKAPCTNSDFPPNRPLPEECPLIPSVWLP